MAALLKALRFDSKPEYTDKIPESLSAEEFDVHKVRRDVGGAAAGVVITAPS